MASSRARLLLLALTAATCAAELTVQEAHECRAHPELIAFELRGGVVLELLLMLIVVCFMYVLIEEYYVPTLELICSKEVLNMPKAIVGCTVMAAGNCLPELSISLVSILANGQDIGTGEVLGSCATRRGLRSSRRPPWPSAPRRPEPQLYTWPASHSASVCSSPAQSCSTRRPARSPLTVTGASTGASWSSSRASTP